MDADFFPHATPSWLPRPTRWKAGPSKAPTIWKIGTSWTEEAVVYTMKLLSEPFTKTVSAQPVKSTKKFTISLDIKASAASGFCRQRRTFRRRTTWVWQASKSMERSKTLNSGASEPRLQSLKTLKKREQTHPVSKIKKIRTLYHCLLAL